MSCIETPNSRNSEMLHIRSMVEISPSDRWLRSNRDFACQVFERESILTLPTLEIQRSMSYRQPTTLYDPTVQISSRFRVPTTLTFDFSISRVSEMLISCHVSSGSNDPDHFTTSYFTELEDGSWPLSSSQLY
jgi:hypothetical protein